MMEEFETEFGASLVSADLQPSMCDFVPPSHLGGSIRAPLLNLCDLKPGTVVHTKGGGSITIKRLPPAPLLNLCDLPPGTVVQTPGGGSITVKRLPTRHQT
jgi:hypothetical protein